MKNKGLQVAMRGKILSDEFINKTENTTQKNKKNTDTSDRTIEIH